MLNIKKILLLLFIGFRILLYSQEDHTFWFDYISPLPQSEYVMPEQKITFRLNERVPRLILFKTDVHLSGTKSGTINGTIKLASDNKTLIFSPDKPFILNETISLVISFPEMLKLPEFKTYFRTTSLDNKHRLAEINRIREKEFGVISIHTARGNRSQSSSQSLPEGFPEITLIQKQNPSPGYTFISPLNYTDFIFYMIMLDNDLTPVFYRELPLNGGTDFKSQPNGNLSIFLYQLNKFLVLDSNFDVTDTIGAGNGYTADLHELRLYEDGHAFLLAYDPQVMDMSQVVPGGQQFAVVTGLIVQELDENEDVVFQWRSWVHYEITDASNWVDLTAESIDYVHGNSIEVHGEAIMISSRNMNEITRIDRNTGDIIWRLNGENNMFDFNEPADSFCMQHSIRLMPDSVNISVFDNGNCWFPPYSSAREYVIDTESYTATQVSQFRSSPDIYGPFMGNTQRLHNGHTINGWGNAEPSVTEFDENGNILLEYSFPHLNYRAFKFNWNHTVFTTNTDHIEFGSIGQQDSSMASFTVYNTYSNAISINKVVNHESSVAVTNELPINIPAGDSAEINVKLKPVKDYEINDKLTLCWDINSDTLVQRIALQVGVSATVLGNAGEIPGQDKIRIFPNPARDHVFIVSTKHLIRSIRLSDLKGNLLQQLEKINSYEYLIEWKKQEGIYFIQVMLEDGTVLVRKLVIRSQ